MLLSSCFLDTFYSLYETDIYIIHHEFHPILSYYPLKRKCNKHIHTGPLTNINPPTNKKHLNLRQFVIIIVFFLFLNFSIGIIVPQLQRVEASNRIITDFERLGQPSLLAYFFYLSVVTLVLNTFVLVLSRFILFLYMKPI